MRVDANTAATWRIIKIDPARRWLEVVGRVFSIDTALDRVEPRFCMSNMLRKWLARSNADLLLDEVAQSLEAPTAERLQEELAELTLLEYCRSALDRLTR